MEFSASRFFYLSLSTIDRIGSKGGMGLSLKRLGVGFRVRGFWAGVLVEFGSLPFLFVFFGEIHTFHVHATKIIVLWWGFFGGDEEMSILTAL